MSFESPASIQYDTGGNPIPQSGSVAIPVGTSFLPIGGQTFAGTASMLSLDASGAINTSHSDTSGSFRYNTSRLAHLGAFDITTGKLSTLRASTEGFLFITGSLSTQAAGTQTVTGSVALSQTATVKEEATSTAAFTSVSASTAINTTIIASNALRRAATVHNDSGKILYLKLGTGAEDRYFSVRMAAQSYYEVPGWWTGIVTGVWTGATGSAKVTELSL